MTRMLNCFILITFILFLSNNVLVAENFSVPVNVSPVYYYGVIANTGIPGLEIENQADFIFSDSSDYGQYSVRTYQSEGMFRRFYDPGYSNDLYYSAFGKKHLTEHQVFSGLFCYHDRRLKDVAWTHNRDSYSAFPFVLADSSVGGYSLRGLLWQVNYASELISGRLFSGISLFYNIDENVKTVFPRPENLNRDMMLNASISYRINQSSIIGITSGYFNFQENLNTSQYNKDQEKTPLFFKTRGLELPVIFRGQTAEERLYEINGYSLMLNGYVKLGKRYTSEYLGYFEQVDANSVDGGIDPIEQGNWNSDRYYFKVNTKWQVSESVTAYVISSGMYYDKTAYHPDFDLDMYHEKSRFLQGETGIYLGDDDRIKLVPGVLFKSQTFKRLDLFNGILDYFPGTLWGFQMQIQTPTKDHGNLSLSFGSDIYKTRKSTVISTEETGFYYDMVTSVDEQYYMTDYRTFRFSEVLSFGQNRQYAIILNYQRIFPRDDINFKNQYRDHLQVSFIVDNPLD